VERASLDPHIPLLNLPRVQRMKTAMGMMSVSQCVVMEWVFFSQVFGEKLGLAYVKVLVIDCPGLKYDGIFGQETMQLMKLNIDYGSQTLSWGVCKDTSNANNNNKDNNDDTTDIPIYLMEWKLLSTSTSTIEKKQVLRTQQ
jgi:hypothetical protein